MMMRKGYIFTMTLLLALGLQVQAQQQKQRLSPVTRAYLEDLKAMTQDAQPTGYLYKKHANGGIYVPGVIQVANATDAEDKLKRIGAIIGTKAGDIWTVQVPYNKVPQFTEISSIGYIQLDEPVRPMMDVARKSTRVDSVHAGYNLPWIFSGHEVVLGVMDFGFDYAHPAFYDTTYTTYRVKKVWEMGGTGTPPAGYTYGRELVGEANILAAGTDNGTQIHGTSVAGMAGGSGYGGTADHRGLRGMAFNTDMVFVCVRRDSIGGQWMSGGFSDFIDGVKYIFDYATSVNRPAVVNISWGSQSGPHDGTTLVNKAFDNMSGPGKIVVMSAGNDGEEDLHLAKVFTATDTIVNTFPIFTSNAYKRTWLDIWGETGKSFSAKITMFKNGAATTSTGYVSLDNTVHNLYLLGANGLDTCYTQFITSSAEAFNGKPRITINIFDKTVDSFFVTIKSTDGTVHMWNEYYYYGYVRQYASTFKSCNQSWAVSGNTMTTVSDMGAGQSVLLVGAYTSRVQWKAINGKTYSIPNPLNAIAGFSSRGPMADGRIKPDIAAPGLYVGTAVSSYDTRYSANGSLNTLTVGSYVSSKNSKTYYYAEFSGTSAASPAASGIVALMLEANPRLTPAQAKDIIAKTAIQDAFTGVLPVGGNNTWGNGKINGYGAVKMALQQNSVYEFKGRMLDLILYPNPNNGKFNLEYTSSKGEQLDIMVTSVTGVMMKHLIWQTNSGTDKKELDLSTLAKGVYVVNVASGDGKVSIKTVIQ